MSLFALTAVGGTGFGPVVAGFIEQNTKLEWRWIQWFHLMLDVTCIKLSLILTLLNFQQGRRSLCCNFICYSQRD
jgi:hypothetical protein